MKHIYISIIFLCALTFTAKAETWNGSTSSNWNTPANWTPANVPTLGSTVIIPGGTLPNFPQLTSNVTFRNINMQSGSKLDVNGFVVNLQTVNAYNTFVGDTINNSAPGTNIIFNINTGTGGYSTSLSGSVYNDTATFNLTGSNAFFEGNGLVPSTYNFDMTYNVNSTLDFNLSNGSASNFLGNVIVNRANVGNSVIFNTGGTVANNFSYNNPVGGLSAIGSTISTTVIGGIINVNITDTTNQPMTMARIKNMTTGGTINVNNSRGFLMQDDSLLVTSLSITGYKGSAYAYFDGNQIIGDVTISADSTYGGGYFTSMSRNTITGNTTINNNSSNTFLETNGSNAANVFNGNTIFNCSGSGAMRICHAASSTFNGDVSINRTKAGLTHAFYYNATINGNFSYTNSASGATILGEPTVSTLISGTVIVAANLTTPETFEMYRINNQTAGGNVTVQNSRGCIIQNDTLIVNSLSVLGYKGNAYAYLFGNDITADVTFTADNTYAGGYVTEFRSNKITGNTLVNNNCSNAFLEGYYATAAGEYNGNVMINANGTGGLDVSYYGKSIFNGNLTINRTVAGNTFGLGAGPAINGNFSYTNNTSGQTYFGTSANPTNITGTVNMLANYTTPAVFKVYRLINLTTGGIIDVKNTQGFDFREDSLRVASLSLTQFRGADYATFYSNEIFGDLTIRDDSTYTGGFFTDIKDCSITGNTVAELNGSNILYEASGLTSANTFTGNTVFTANGSGSLILGNVEKSTYNGNLTINRLGSGATTAFAAGANINGNFVYSNLVGGPSSFGATASKTLITGSINMTVNNDTTPANFNMRGVSNQTAGGAISLQNTRGFDVWDDTLKVTSCSITNYRGNAYAYFYRNRLEGDLFISSDSTYTGGFVTSVDDNTIIGNTTLTNNGPNQFFDANGAGYGNYYFGNVSLVKNGGPLYFGYVDTTILSGNLMLNYNSAPTLGTIKFTGNTNAVIDQSNSQNIVISRLLMDKNADLTLNKPVRVGIIASFANGKINTDTTNRLTFNDNAVAVGGNNASYVSGPIAKIGNDVFTFPLGKNNKYAPLSISAPAVNTDAFTAEYFNANAQTAGYDTSMKGLGIDHVSRNEYWICNRTAGTSNAFVTLSWDTVRSGIINNIPDLRVARWDGTTWQDQGQGIINGTNDNGTIRTSSAVSNFSPFTLASATTANPLPITLLSFEVKKLENAAQLIWETESEMDLAYFEIERSADAINFEKINEVATTDKVNGVAHYELLDVQPMIGRNFYRLKMVDHDGKFTHSETRSINFSKKIQATVYPNPVNETIQISAENKIVMLEIYDITGKLIDKKEGQNITQYNMAAFEKGIYFIKLYIQDDVETFRILKL